MTVMINLKPAVFKHVEAELYSYHETKKEIKRLREQILHDSIYDDENTKPGRNSVRSPGRPTERIATRLLTDKRLRNLEEIVEAIETVLSTLDETQLKLIKLRYFSRSRRLSWDGIARECNIHVQTAYKYRRLIVHAIAEKLGWI